MGNLKITICGWICVFVAACVLLFTLPDAAAAFSPEARNPAALPMHLAALGEWTALLVAGLMMVRRLRGVIAVVVLALALSLVSSYLNLFRVMKPVDVHTLHYARAALAVVWDAWLIGLLRIPSVRSEFGLGRRRRSHRMPS